MSLRGNKENFFAAHYDWLAVGVGILALAAGAVFYVMALGEEEAAAVQDNMAEVQRMKPSKTGVKDLDLSAYETASKLVTTPPTVHEVSVKTESFLASERRVMCKCKKAISGDVKKFPKCPYCGEKQEEEAVVVIDADGDGMADDWEKRYGLNPANAADADADADKDGFTNLEEYKAKTDPTDPKDHPDYLDSLKIVLPLKQTYLPFAFTKATKIPAGWRCEFFDPKKKDVKRGNTGYVTATVGEEIEKSGYVVKSYEQKAAKREKKGMKGMFFNVDVSEVKLERKTDGKSISLVICSPKTFKPAPVDVQATLVYERGATKNFEVVPGTEIDLNGTKYRISEIKAVGKGAKVTVENSLSTKKRVIEALEQ